MAQVPDKKIKIQKPEWLVSEKIKELIVEVISDLGVEITPEDVYLEHPADDSHGDYATNIAMAKFKIFKFSNVQKFKKVKNPMQLAGLISEKINEAMEQLNNEAIDRVAVAPPGFINFWLKKDYLIQAAAEIGDEEKFKRKMAESGQDKTMIIDYSAPNIAKPFGIGHLRSTNIGQAIYNLYSILGWETIGDNHLGDWGTQFGKLIVAVKKWWDKDLEDLTIADLLDLYVKFHQQVENDSDLEDEARKWFKKLEQEDEEAKKIWQFCVDISLKEFDRVYEILDVEIDEAYGEAFYHYQGWVDKVLEDTKEKGLVEESRGAQVIELPGMKVPGMLLKTDGATTYLTRDLATIKFRMEKWDPELIVYEVGSPQKFHFNQVFQLSEKLGYVKKEKLVHVAHGLIGGEGGKFSTREGDSIKLEDVLKEAVERAEKLVENSGTSKDLTEEEKKEIAQAVGIGGVKFNDLKQEPEKDIVFDWDLILNMDGYSAPYLQYTFARTQSVLAKAKSYQLKAKSYELNEEEEALLRVFYKFPEVIISSAENFAPHLICQYLFDLAQKFNLFYQKHRILEPQQSNKVTRRQCKGFRLFLTKTTASILKTGLELLGIKALERM